MAEIGIGTNLCAYKQEKIEDLLEIIKAGIKLGYKFIDTGDIIDDNTNKVFNLLTQYQRKKFFITTRVYDYTTENEFKLRIGDLKYIDLCNFGNAPVTTSRMVFNNVCLKIWSSMIVLKESGLVKNLGIINFHYKQAKVFLELCKAKEFALPSVAYIEIHPLNLQEDLVKLYQSYNIHIVAFTPLGGSAHNFFAEHKVIDQIQKEIEAQTFAQTVLATTMSRGISVVVKTLDVDHLASNLKTYQYVNKITESHLDLLADINLDAPLNNDSTNAINASQRLP